MRPVLLPDPWITYAMGEEARSLSDPNALSSGAAAGANNRAVYVPVTFPIGCTVYALRFVATNATGNFDLGFYDASFSRIASTGSTAMAAAVQSLALGEYRVHPGRLYYAALVLSSTSGNILRWGGTVAVGSSGLPVAGILHEASALPLPATATPVFPLDSVWPMFAFGVR